MRCPKCALITRRIVAVLTHDPKFDDAATRIALAHPVRYIGALGSRRTQERRKATLREAGVPRMTWHVSLVRLAWILARKPLRNWR